MVALLRAARIVGWRRHLPLIGRPDFVFPKKRICVFVDGCFWHGCPRCYGGAKPKRKMPASNVAYWQAKVRGNVRRDKKIARLFRARGYAIIRIRECELNKKPQTITAKIARKLKEKPQ